MSSSCKFCCLCFLLCFSSLQSFSTELILILLIEAYQNMGKEIYTNSSLFLSACLCTIMTSKPIVSFTVYLGIWILGVGVWVSWSFRSGWLSDIGRVQKPVTWRRSREGDLRVIDLVRYFCYNIKLFFQRFIFFLVIKSKDRFYCLHQCRSFGKC